MNSKINNDKYKYKNNEDTYSDSYQLDVNNFLTPKALLS